MILLGIIIAAPASIIIIISFRMAFSTTMVHGSSRGQEISPEEGWESDVGISMESCPVSSLIESCLSLTHSAFSFLVMNDHVFMYFVYLGRKLKSTNV